MSASMLETLCRITGMPDDDWKEVDVTIRVTRPWEYEVRWRRWYPGAGWSEYRVATGSSLQDALVQACTREWKNPDRAQGARGSR